MTAKHTPGPWGFRSVVGDEPGTLRIVQSNSSNTESNVIASGVLPDAIAAIAKARGEA